MTPQNSLKKPWETWTKYNKNLYMSNCNLGWMWTLLQVEISLAQANTPGGQMSCFLHHSRFFGPTCVQQGYKFYRRDSMIHMPEPAADHGVI